MCSANSITDSSTDSRGELAAALSHVAEDCFYAVLEQPPDDWRDDWHPGTEWLEGALTFRGAGEGVLTCRVPRPLAAEMSAAFLGADVEALTDDAVADMVGELANMLCGCWLSRAFPTHLFQLDHPEVTTVNELPSDNWLVGWVNGHPVGVAVAVGRVWP